MAFRKYLVTAAFLFVCVFISIPDIAFAHRPLTTQYANPESVHKIKLESGIKYTNFPHGDEAYNLDIEVNYGVINNLDVGVDVPYVFWRPDEVGDTDTVGDMILKSRLLFLKGREGNPLSLTIQPFFKIPTAESNREILQSGPGLSTGETNFRFVFIATREMSPLLIAHMNLGYVFINRPSFLPGKDYENVFSFKIAVEYVTDKDIELVGELSGETNKNPAEDDPFSMLLGARYKMKDGVLLDAGFSAGLSDSSPDSTATLGLTLAF